MSTLTVTGLSKSFSTEILRDISIQLEAGSFLMLLGANGSGKTTLLTSLLGLHEHTGSVTVAGSGGVHPARTGLTGVLDRSALYPRWTVRRNLQYLLNAEDAVEAQPVKRLIPEPLLDQRAKTLSTGQAKMVMLARALASPAPVILLDEFSNGLDRSARKLAREMLFRARDDENKIVVATGHDLSVFTGLPTDVAIIRDGTLHTLTDRYAELGGLEETYAEFD